MRKRKYLIGALLSVIGALVVSSTAQATVDSQTLSVVASPSKQDKKAFGPVASFANDVGTQYSGACCSPTATQTVLTYDKGFKFTPGNLPQCPLASVENKTQAAATAACGGSIVGGGSAQLSQGPLNLSAVVTAFNGQPQNGHPTIYLHSNVNNDFADPVLVGELDPASNTLTVAINSAGLAIKDFQTTINKIKTGKKKVKVNGKKKTQPVYYIMARCKSKSWTTTETTTFAGGITKSATTTQPCQQKKTKKKK
jgi:hypothetical protein